jgi:hypothetical protein
LRKWQNNIQKIIITGFYPQLTVLCLNNINPPRSYLFPSNSTVKLLQAEIAHTARSIDRKTPGIKKFTGRALVWSDRQVYVTDCDPQTGKP